MRNSHESEQNTRKRGCVLGSEDEISLLKGIRKDLKSVSDYLMIFRKTNCFSSGTENKPVGVLDMR
jgi:hypothetical protein